LSFRLRLRLRPDKTPGQDAGTRRYNKQPVSLGTAKHCEDGSIHHESQFSIERPGSSSAKGVLGRQAGAEILDNFSKGGKDITFELILIQLRDSGNKRQVPTLHRSQFQEGNL